jgi:hypothetical protein
MLTTPSGLIIGRVVQRANPHIRSLRIAWIQSRMLIINSVVFPNFHESFQLLATPSCISCVTLLIFVALCPNEI